MGVSTPAATDGRGIAELEREVLGEIDLKVQTRVLSMFLKGNTRKTIARKLKLEREVVIRTIRKAEVDGRLPALRTRLAAQLKDILEDTALEWSKKTEQMTPHGFAAFFDKMQLLDGQATQVIEVRRDREDRGAVLRRLRELANGVTTVVDVAPAVPGPSGPQNGEGVRP